jgi:hypothetical protein
MSTKYEWEVWLESQTGFVLDTDQLSVDELGFLNTPLTDSRVKIRSVSFQGGRNRELDAIPPSTATIVFDNRDGLFNPENTASPYYGLIFPGKQMRLYFLNLTNLPVREDIAVFAGVVTDWSFDFDVNGDATATLSAKDTLGLIAGVTIPLTAVPEETAGQRFRRICLLGGLNAALVVVNGSYSTMAAGTIEGDALKLAQEAIFHEQGYSYVDSGVVYFQPRNLGQDPKLGFSDVALPGESSIPYTSIAFSYSNDTVANNVTTVSSLGTAVATDAAQVAQFGKTSAQYDVSYSTFSQQRSLTNFLVASYGVPEFRPDSMTVSVDDLYTQVAPGYPDTYFVAPTFIFYTYYFGAPASVYFNTPPGDNPVSKQLVVSSWSHSSTPSRYDVSIGFELNPFRDVFVLDDQRSGVLDTSKLAF